MQVFEMACLRVPFEGNSIQELYKKINKGIISRIPKKYSKELSDMIKLCLTKDQKRRPSVSELLEHSSVIKRMENDMPRQEEVIPGELWQTIKLPKNLDQLIQRLPKKKYRKSSRERKNNTRAHSVGNVSQPKAAEPRNFKKNKPEWEPRSRLILDPPSTSCTEIPRKSSPSLRTEACTVQFRRPIFRGGPPKSDCTQREMHSRVT